MKETIVYVNRRGLEGKRGERLRESWTGMRKKLDRLRESWTGLGNTAKKIAGLYPIRLKKDGLITHFLLKKTGLLSVKNLT